MHHYQLSVDRRLSMRHPDTAVRSNRSMPIGWLRGLLLAIALVAWYLQVQVLFPYAPYLIAGIALFLLRPITWNDAFIVATFTVLGAVSILPTVFSVAMQQGFREQFSSFALLFLTIASSLGLYKWLVAFGQQRMLKLAMGASAVIVLAAIAEVTGPLRPISDAFREIVYPPSALYVAEVRDLHMVGFVRPKVFTAEPSHVAMGLAVFSVIATITSTSFARFSIVVGFCILGLVLIGSPVMLGSLFFIVIFGFVKFDGLKLLRNPLMLAGIFIFVLIAGLGAYSIAAIFAERLGLSGGGSVEGSVFVRVYAPWLTALHALGERPWLGFGIGAQQNLQHIYVAVLLTDITPSYQLGQSLEDGLTMHNAHGLLLVQFGIVGGLIWLVAWHYTAQRLGRRGLVWFWSFYLMFGMTLGGIHAPVFWGGLMMVLAALRVRALGDGVLGKSVLLHLRERRANLSGKQAPPLDNGSR